MKRTGIVAATAVAIIATLVFITARDSRPEKKHSFRPQDMAVPLPTDRPTPTPTPIPQMDPIIKDHQEDIREKMSNIQIKCEMMELRSLGTYFITGYCACSRCCGQWAHGETASGATVHRADEEHRLTEPTTAAIDPRLHKFGELIYVPSEDRVYICEDTGSGVKGKWLDCYQSDHSAVQSFNTRREELFSVSWKSITFRAGDYDIILNQERGENT